MLQAVFKNVLGDHAGAAGGGQQAHERRLQIGGEAGEGLGAQVYGANRLCLDRHAGAVDLHLAARFLQLGEHGPQVVADHGGHRQGGAGDGRRQQEGARFDAVWDHGVVGAVQALHPGDRDRGGAGAAHLGPHGQQQPRQIHHLRLQGGVFDHRFALRQAGRHHQGLGGADAGAVEVDAPAAQAMAAAGHHRRHHTVLNGDLGPQGLEAFDVLHHRAGADLAATGQGHPGDPQAGQQRADAEEAGPQAVHQLVGGCRLVQPRAVHLQAVAAAPHAYPQGNEDVGHPLDVGEGRNVAQPQLVFGEQAGGHQHQR